MKISQLYLLFIKEQTPRLKATNKNYSKYTNHTKMKKQLLLFLFTILAFNCYSQIAFEKGYYINNSDQRVDCLIKNLDWTNNPTEFKIKLSEDTTPKTINLKSVKEFGIHEVSRFVRFTVNIDISSDNIKHLSKQKEPIYDKKQFFLKVLVEGKANLFEYQNKNLKRYFYNKQNSEVQQLIFKTYKLSKTQIAKNYKYKHQLFSDLKYDDLTLSEIRNVDYNKKDLVAFFINYNEKYESEVINFTVKQKKGLVRLYLRPGLNHSSLKMQNGLSDRNIDFESKLAFRFGIEAEFVLPYNKNKWAILIEPTFQYYKSENETVYTESLTHTSSTNVEVNYSSIELPIGLRYHSFINDHSKIFFNASYVFDVPVSGTIQSERKDLFDLQIKSNKNLALGVGYSNNRYSLELRYHTKRDLSNGYTFWKSNYKTMSVIFGYRIF